MKQKYINFFEYPIFRRKDLTYLKLFFPCPLGIEVFFRSLRFHTVNFMAIYQIS